MAEREPIVLTLDLPTEEIRRLVEVSRREGRPLAVAEHPVSPLEVRQLIDSGAAHARIEDTQNRRYWLPPVPPKLPGGNRKARRGAAARKRRGAP